MTINECHDFPSVNLSEVENNIDRKYSRKTTGWVGLHVHSHFSLLDGFRSPTELVERVEELGQPAIALTDHGGLWGIPELMSACANKGIVPIAGNEMYLVDNIATQRLKEYAGDGDYKVKSRYHQLVLAVSRKGYENLCKLTSNSYLRNYTINRGRVYPVITKEELAEHKEGLVVTSGCLAGLVCQGILSGDIDFAKATAQWYKDNFGDNYYIEIQDHNAGDDQRKVNQHLVAIADELKIGLVVTADSHYVYPQQKYAHKNFLRVNKGEKFSNVYKGSFWHPSENEIAKRISYLPDWAVNQALDNTVLIAQKVEPYTLHSNPKSPDFPLPAPWKDSNEYLSYLCKEGLKRINKEGDNVYVERINYELEILKLKKLADYFLVVHDYVNWAKNQQIPVGVGRGSGGGSLACYLLNITAIDPIEHGLIFERFINPEREAYPDIDVDFCMDRREEVVGYIQDKYGKDNVANIITFNKLESRSAFKDAGWVLGISFDTQNFFTKTLPVIRGKNIKLKAIINDGSLAPAFYKLYINNPIVENGITFRQWVDLAIELEGSLKSHGIHASGLVIGDDSLKNLIPLQRNKDGTIVTQYTMYEVELMGVLKMDILGLKTLTVLSQAQKFIGGNYYDLEKIDINDSNALNLLTQSTTGIFQLESAGKMIDLVKPKSFNEVADITSLIRPGCFDLNMHIEYTNVKFGVTKPTYCTPKLEPILGKTYSQCLYQEQLLRICTDIAGFSLGFADNVRRGCEKKQVLEPLEQVFKQGCISNGESLETANELWEIILASAGYSFNASHSKAYTIISMQCAWMRYYHPSAFFAALLSGQKDTDKFADYAAILKQHNVKLLPPNINKSNSDFIPTDNGILFGLSYIKGIGDKALADVFAERKKGIFTSVSDFFSRVKVSQAIARKLVNAGAFDTLESNRGKLLSNLPNIFQWLNSQKVFAKKEQASLSIPGIDWDTFMVYPVLKDASDLSLKEKLDNEKEVLGVALSGHILNDYKLDSEYLGNLTEGQNLKGVVLMLEVRNTTTKNGGKMGFITVEDILGNKVKCTLFPSTWSIAQSCLKVGSPIHIEGKVGTYNNNINVVINRVKSVI